MANWHGSARSNYFRVRDEEAFLAWVEDLPGITAHPKGCGGEKTFCLLEEDGEGWPSVRSLEVPVIRTAPLGAAYEDFEEEIDFPGELSAHLAEGKSPSSRKSGRRSSVTSPVTRLQSTPGESA